MDKSIFWMILAGVFVFSIWIEWHKATKNNDPKSNKKTIKQENPSTPHRPSNWKKRVEELSNEQKKAPPSAEDQIGTLLTSTTTFTIPTDNEFLQRGWLLNDWFNHEVLYDALNISQGWDVSRSHLQKIAYRIVRPEYPHDQKQWFRRCMAQFVKNDPVYLSVIGQVKSAVEKHPGMLQSDIYKERSESDKEAARYVLYFAEELEDIIREKSGRSYKLYPLFELTFDYQAAAEWVLRNTSLPKGVVENVALAVESQKYKAVNHAFGEKDFDWPWFEECLEAFKALGRWPSLDAWELNINEPKLLNSKSQVLEKIPGKELKIIAVQHDVIIPSKLKVAEVRALLEQALESEQLAQYTKELNSAIAEKHMQKRLAGKYKLLESTINTYVHHQRRYNQIRNMRAQGYRPAIDWSDDFAKEMSALSNRKIPPFYPGDGSSVENIPPKDSWLDRTLKEKRSIEEWTAIE